MRFFSKMLERNMVQRIKQHCEMKLCVLVMTSCNAYKKFDVIWCVVNRHSLRGLYSWGVWKVVHDHKILGHKWYALCYGLIYDIGLRSVHKIRQYNQLRYFHKLRKLK